MIDIKTGKEIENPAVLKAPLAGSANATVGGMMRNVGGAMTARFGEKKPYDEELEYLESRLYHYIDTGIVMKFPCSVDTRIYYNAIYIDQMAFGARSNNHLATIWSGPGSTYTRFGDNFTSEVISERIWCDIHSETGKIVVNGNTTEYGGSFNNDYSTNTFFLFGANGLTTSVRVKIAYLDLVSNSIPVRKMIPVLKNGVPCMYDKIGGDFYYNKIAGHQFGYKKKDGTIVDPT